MREVKNRHHIFPRSRKNGQDILGVCENKNQQKVFYHDLVGQEDIIEAFKFFNETFWDKHYEISEIYYNKTGLKSKKKRSPSKVELRLRKRRVKKNSVCIRRVPKNKHETYHFLFGNMMPWEAFEKLNKVFWKNTFIIKEACI